MDYKLDGYSFTSINGQQKGGANVLETPTRQEDEQVDCLFIQGEMERPAKRQRLAPIVEGTKVHIISEKDSLLRVPSVLQHYCRWFV